MTGLVEHFEKSTIAIFLTFVSEVVVQGSENIFDTELRLWFVGSGYMIL